MSNIIMSITTQTRNAEGLRFQIGTSGFMTSQKLWLKCKSMNCIELNSSFYRIPSDKVIQNLLKMPQHIKVVCKVIDMISAELRPELCRYQCGYRV